MTDAHHETQELLDKFDGTEELPPGDKEAVVAVMRKTDRIELPETMVKEPEGNAAVTRTPASPMPMPGKSEADKDHHDLRTMISKMSLPQKIKLAMFGNSVCRSLLVRDSNKLVQMCVLKNPKLQLGEVEDFAKSTTASEQVLRSIAHSQTWMKSYNLKYNVVTNSKTPIDISLRWMKFLHSEDLKKLSKSKNVPQVISNAAKKRIMDEAKRK